ncbi:MAG TPA: ATP-binding protein [Spirochaetales bacterium]|nr:ATP-binding protein [Spirochaetales bacterium]HRY53224.1 ATP-binding protein [Spirochaetia bacterium]HRZ63643.1 ATP-binding protein [Spirochaetia bacterium]
MALSTGSLILAALLLGLFVLVLREQRRKARYAEAKAREYAAMSEALVLNSPRGVHFYELDEGDRLVFSGYNRAADRILGIDHASLIGKSIGEAFPGLVETEVPARYLEAALEGKAWQTEQVQYEEGRIKGAYEVIAFQTKRRAMAAVFSDITEAKRASEELERQRAFTKALIESLPGIFYLYDYPGLKLRWWNRNHETAFGYATEELAGMDIRSWHVQEAKAAVLEAVEACMREGSAQVEAPLVAKDGKRTPYLLTGTRFESGGEYFLIGVGIDISERVEAEEELRLLNQELEERVVERTSLLSEANANLQGALRELKASQAKILLSEKMAALGQLVAGLAHELNTPLGAILSSCSTSRSAASSLPGLLARHRALSEPEAAAFARISAGLACDPVWADRAEERRRRNGLRACLEAAGLAEASLLAEQLVDSGYAGSGEELAELARLPRFDEIVEMAHDIGSICRADYIIRTAAEKAARVILALRTYARREEDERLSLADPREQLETVLVILESKLKRGVEVLRDYGELPPVPCHPDRLSQVWMNLVNNAIQAMDYRGRLELVARAIPPAGGGPGLGSVEVSVIDDGPGVPESIRERIFEPFFTTKASGEGSGLGLDICRRILEEIGATIDFESRPGRTRFTVSLPAGPKGVAWPSGGLSS